MSIGSPRTARPRDDLPFLRHRRRPTPSTPTDLGASLDLSTPASATRPVSAPPPPTRPRSVSPAHPPQLAYRPPRTRPGVRTVLTEKAPTVTLTRIQSGIGVLTFQAASSELAADLHLGCAYRLRSGQSGVVHHLGGPTTAPPNSARPIIIAEPTQQDRLTLDLLQSRDIDRLIVYAFSDSGAPLRGSLALIANTFGQARIDMPFERSPSTGIVVLMSLYNIGGEFVLRAEMEDIAGSVRDACVAYGFDQITWLGPRTALL